METPNKKRKMKTTPQQYQLYVDMLESNKHFRENKVTPDNPHGVAAAWDTLVQSLNASGGPQKSLSEWKRVFTDWKSQVRKRARLVQTSFVETGNKGEPEKELTELEQKLLHVTGAVVVEGIPGLPELGVANEPQLEKAAQEEKEEITEKKTKMTVNKKTGPILEHTNVLNEINLKLQRLIELKEQELLLLRLKLQAKYDITIEDISDENEEGTN